MSAGGGQLQELAQQLDQLEQSRSVLEGEVQSLKQQQTAIDEAIEAIEELDSGSNVQVPLGGGAYVRAEIADIDEILVELGADYVAERDQDGAVTTLESKQDTLDERIEEVRAEIAELETELERLEGQAQQLQSQQMQQLQQRQQDAGE